MLIEAIQTRTDITSEGVKLHMGTYVDMKAKRNCRTVGENWRVKGEGEEEGS